MLDPKGSGAKGYARCGWHFVFNVWASITGVVDEFGRWWANALICTWANIGVVQHVCYGLALVMQMKEATKGKIEGSATGSQGPEAATLQRFKFHPIG
jgi:hypothetical protein